MELLILTPQLPYPTHQGTSLRNFNIIRGLADRHAITLLSFTENGKDIDMQQIRPLADCCQQIVTVPPPVERSTLRRLWQMFLTKDPDLALRVRSRQFEIAFRGLLSNKDFDIVQIEGVELAWIISVTRMIRLDQAIVFDAHNAEAKLQTRAYEADLKSARRWPAAAYSWIQSNRLLRYERWSCIEADWVTTVSENDKNVLLSQLPEERQNITVIPNSIDVAAYEKAKEANEPAANSDVPAIDILFTGKMDYRPNVDAVLWFASEVWPKIIAQRPNSTWAVVGQKPHKRLVSLTELPGVTITGWVEHIQPYLLGSKVFIMPFRVGSGTRLKLLEAMAVGLPVVSTSLGVEGYPVQDGHEILLVDSSEEMAAAILNLLNDPDLRFSIGENGHHFAQQYDWRQITPKFDEVYNALVEL